MVKHDYLLLYLDKSGLVYYPTSPTIHTVIIIRFNRHQVTLPDIQELKSLGALLG